MSNNPHRTQGGNAVRWVITGGLLVLAVLCLGWIVSQKLAGEQSDVNSGTPFVAPAALLPVFAALDLLALIGLGVWVLRPPNPGAIGFFGRWLGQGLLFLGVGAAIYCFFFA